MSSIPHSRPLLGSAEKRALCRVIDSGMLAEGKEVAAFEHELAERVGRRGAVAVHSGTAALTLALEVLGVRNGDRVAMPSYVCSALLHAVQALDAQPVLVDVNPSTFNLDPDDLRRRLRARVKAVIVPHMFGLAAELDAIAACGPPVVEDCALALGARYHGRPVGSFGALAIFSFYATKMIAAGEGGMVVGDRTSLLSHVRDLRSYDGRKRHRRRFNHKMTELQAAVGRIQLRRLESFIQRRRCGAEHYFESLAGGPWELPPQAPGHVYHRFVLRTRRSASRFLSELNRHGIEARRPVFLPLHRYLDQEGFPGAEDAYRRAVSIPLYPALTPAELGRVAQVTRRVGDRFGR